MAAPAHTLRQALLVGGGHAAHHQQLLHTGLLPTQRLPGETRSGGETNDNSSSEPKQLFRRERGGMPTAQRGIHLNSQLHPH